MKVNLMSFRGLAFDAFVLVITQNQSFNAHDFKFWAKKKPCEQRTPTGYLKSQLIEIMKS